MGKKPYSANHQEAQKQSKCKCPYKNYHQHWSG